MDYQTLLKTLTDQFFDIVHEGLEDTGNDIGLVTMTAPETLEAALGELMEEYYK